MFFEFFSVSMLLVNLTSGSYKQEREHFPFHLPAFIKEEWAFRNQLAIDRQYLIDSLPGNLGLLYRGEMKSKKEGVEIHDVLCQACNGKGIISARCRCNGCLRDLEKSNLLGVPVDMSCGRCTGRGFKRTPSTTDYKAIVSLLPDLHERDMES